MAAEDGTMTKDVASDAEADAWLGWVERHYGLVRSSIASTGKGLRVTAYLKTQNEGAANGSAYSRGSSLSDAVEGLVAALLAEVKGGDVEAQVDALASIAAARAVLERYEDAELERLSGQASLRVLATASGVSPEAVRKRLRRSESARRRRY